MSRRLRVHIDIDGCSTISVRCIQIACLGTLNLHSVWHFETRITLWSFSCANGTALSVKVIGPKLSLAEDKHIGSVTCFMFHELCIGAAAMQSYVAHYLLSGISLSLLLLLRPIIMP